MTICQEKKIEREVRQHNKKVKKEAKAKVKSSVKKPKIVTVPGDCPFKETISKEAISLRESLKQKKRLTKETAIKRDEIKAHRKAKREILLTEKRGLPAIPQGGKTNSSDAGTNCNAQLTNVEGKKVNSIEDLMKRAQERGYQFEKIELSENKRDPSLKAFYREFLQVKKGA